jgi:hypothetical protein
MLGDLCVEQAPPWQDVGEGHAYRCHIPADELRRLQVADAGARVAKSAGEPA